MLEQPHVRRLVQAVDRRIGDRAPARHQRVVPVGALHLGDLGPERLGHAGRVLRQIAPRHGLAQQGVIHPGVGDELGRLAVYPHALASAGHDVGQPLGRELLAAGLRGHVGMGGEELAEVPAAGEAGPEDRHQDHVSSHDISIKGSRTHGFT